MNFDFTSVLLTVLAASILGGLLARVLKIAPIVGYIVAGVLAGAISPVRQMGIDKLAEVGVVLLLFSVGVELSLSRLSRVLKVATVGAFVQIILVSVLSWIILRVWGIRPTEAIVLSLGFSVSSTAILVKILADRGETDTLHGEVMVGWSLVQDLAVIPMMVGVSALANAGQAGVLLSIGTILLQAGGVVISVLLLGRLVAPYILHKIASSNSRELLIISAVFLALGTAALTSLFGISPALGAFLAGVVISESQEKHAVFAETRPLRDLFVAAFFVTLGLLATPSVIIAKFGLILALAVFVIVIKFLVVAILSLILGYHGKTAIAAGLGLAQVGEFSFVIFSQARGLNLLTPEMTSVGIATALLTLLAAPFLFKSTMPFWRFLREAASKWAWGKKFILGWDKNTLVRDREYSGHIIICGFGRVGEWVGKALSSANIPFVVVEYNQSVVGKLKEKGVEIIYGDPTHAEVLQAAGIESAKAIVVAIPDRVAQEEIIAHVQTAAPAVKIITRAHFDEDWEKLKILKVDKIVQPEFEAAIAIIKSIFSSMGKSKEEVGERVKNLRLSRAAI